MRKRGILAVSVLAVVGLVSCGSSTPAESSGALARIHASVGLTEAAGTAHVVSVTDTTGPTGSGAVHLNSVGDVAFDGPGLRVKMTVHTGTEATTSTSTAIHMNGYVYMQVGVVPNVWTRSPEHQTYAYLGAVETSALTDTKGPVVVGGIATINGQSATEYLVQLAGSTKTESLSNSTNQPYSAHLSIAPFVLSVWLDHAGRIVRTRATQKTTVTQTGPGAPSQSIRSTQSVEETTTTTLSNFGTPVEITAPAVISNT